MANPHSANPSLLTMEEIKKTAIVTVNTVNALGYPCYLFGSMAAALYGINHRTPGDVDIVVLADSAHDIEDIKKEIVAQSNRFLLKPSSNPEKTYQKLYFKVPHNHDGANSRRQRNNEARKECKVDIILHGTIHTPYIPDEAIVWRHGLPLAPFKTLVLLKLFGWYEHRVHEWKKYRAERDCADIRELLSFSMVSDVLARGGDWCPKDLHESAKPWVCEFVGRRPSRKDIAPWYVLDFNIERGIQRYEEDLPRSTPCRKVWHWVVTIEVK